MRKVFISLEEQKKLLNDPSTDIGKTKLLVDQFFVENELTGIEHHSIDLKDMYGFVIDVQDVRTHEHCLISFQYHTYNLRDAIKKNLDLTPFLDKLFIQQDYYVLVDLVRNYVDRIQGTGPYAFLPSVKDTMHKLASMKKTLPSTKLEDLVAALQSKD